MLRIPNTGAIIEKWEPRIGSHGARWFAVAIWSSQIMLPLGLLLFAAIALNASAGGAAPTAVVVLVSIVAFANATLIGLAPFLARRCASRFLGIKVTRSNYPPNDDRAYEAWCRANGFD